MTDLAGEGVGAGVAITGAGVGDGATGAGGATTGAGGGFGLEAACSGFGVEITGTTTTGADVGFDTGIEGLVTYFGAAGVASVFLTGAATAAIG